MRLLYIGGFDLPDNNAAAQRVISNAKVFRELGYEVKLMGLDKTPSVLEYAGFQCVNLKYPDSFKGWWEYVFTLNWYKKEIDSFRPSIVVAYNHPAAALKHIHKYCQKLGIKVLADCTEWYSPEGSFLRRLIKGWDVKKRMTKVHSGLDGIISISKYLQDYYTSKQVKSIQLPPLVDLEEEKWEVNASPAERGDIIKLIYAGSPGLKDWLDKIVSIVSAERFRDRVSMEVIGLDDNQFKSWYSYSEPVPDNIHFEGRLPHPEVIKRLRNSDFQVFIRENNLMTKAGFPTKFVESISAGVPVLTNLSSNIGDYLIDGVNGFILNYENENALRESLDRVLAMSREEIEIVKNKIDRSVFDYRRYVPSMRSFLSLIDVK